jgi:hypothetical protein
MFCVILRVNSDYFFKQREADDLCGGEGVSFLCSMDRTLHYYLYELRLRKVKVNFRVLCSALIE